MTITKDTSIAHMARPTTVNDCYQGYVVLTAGQAFKVETSPDGEELLEITCPVGKVWVLSVRVEYKEENA